MRFILDASHFEEGATSTALCGLLCGSPLSCEYEHALSVCQAADYTHLMLFI